MSYDVECEELARAFIEDARNAPDEKMVKELAQEIQDVIESFLEANRL